MTRDTEQKKIQIIRVNGEIETFDKPCTLKNMQAVVGGSIEHVLVLDRIEGEEDFVYTSMYVDDEGLLKAKPVNQVATEIYRRNALEQIKRGANPEIFDLTNAMIVGDVLYFKGYTRDEAEELYVSEKEASHV